MKLLIGEINAAQGDVVSLDIPSGLSADTGSGIDQAIRADLTLAFAAEKPAHRLAQAVCGRVVCLEIGIPTGVMRLAQSTEISGRLVSGLLPRRAPDSHKGSFGRLLILAGSRGMGGAAMMSTLAALRTGPGITTLAAPASVVQGIAPQLMEAMTVSLPETPEGSIAGGAVSGITEELERVSACLIGCGLRHTRESTDLVKAVLNLVRGTLVLDADALNCIGENAALFHDLARPAILTPHPGEMARLCGKSVAEILEKPVETALRYASDTGCVVVLKGHRTLVVSPEGELWQNTTGNAGLAKGGSGDVLAGMIAGLAAQGMPPADAAICGVYLHGYAADRLAERMSMRSMLARDLIAELPFAIAAVEDLETE